MDRSIIQPELAVFDMAGTTLHLTDPVSGAMRAALAPFGVAVSDDQIADIRGRSKRQAMLTLLAGQLGRQRAEELVEDCHECFRDQLLELARRRPPTVIPGALETFAWLRDRNIAVALNTGFDRRLAETLLESVGWRELELPIACGDDVAAGRPAPDLIYRVMALCGVDDAGSVIAIGDTTADLEAAQNAGAGLAVGVLTGAHDRGRLLTIPGATLIDSIADLPALIGE